MPQDQPRPRPRPRFVWYPVLGWVAGASGGLLSAGEVSTSALVVEAIGILLMIGVGFLIPLVTRGHGGRDDA